MEDDFSHVNLFWLEVLQRKSVAESTKDICISLIGKTTVLGSGLKEEFTQI